MPACGGFSRKTIGDLFAVIQRISGTEDLERLHEVTDS